MNKARYTKIILCCVIMVVGIWCGWLQLQEARAAAGESSTADVGRDNPFAEIPKKETAVFQKMLRAPKLPVAMDEEPQELLLAIVPLRFLDAENVKQAVVKMLSGYGSISADAKTNSLIICDAKENLERIRAQIEQIDGTEIPQHNVVMEKQRPPLFVETVTLKFLDAKNLVAAIGKMSSEYGSISQDVRSNSLIVCDTKENLEKIFAEIRKADKTPQQIMIEVVIVDVQLDNESEIGINWDLLSDRNYDIGYKQNFTTSRLGSTIEDATTIGGGTAFNSTGAGGDLSVISGTIRNVVHLLQEKKDVEILASPQVMVLSGQSAFLESAEEIPYNEKTESTGGGGGAYALSSTAFKDVGIKLKVSASLTDERLIYLTAEVEQKVKTEESVSGVPVVDARRATTSLLLDDGQVVIIGGLRRQEKTKEVDQIPILGDLPIIGGLFKSTNTVVSNSELIVFLSPHVYKGAPLSDEAMARFNKLKNKPMLSVPDNVEEKPMKQDDK